jgi:hypothetical protein
VLEEEVTIVPHLHLLMEVEVVREELEDIENLLELLQGVIQYLL